jgi:hypothetical protein
MDDDDIERTLADLNAGLPKQIKKARKAGWCAHLKKDTLQ